MGAIWPLNDHQGRHTLFGRHHGSGHVRQAEPQDVRNFPQAAKTGKAADMQEMQSPDCRQGGVPLFKYQIRIAPCCMISARFFWAWFCCLPVVRGAVSLALRLGIPALIVSLTIVALGTSAPELLITVQSVIEGAPGLALGNVVGSNVANVLLVLGLPAILTAIHPGDGDSRRTFLMMIATTAIAIFLCFMGPLAFWHGVVLLGIAGAAASPFLIGSQIAVLLVRAF